MKRMRQPGPRWVAGIFVSSVLVFMSGWTPLRRLHSAAGPLRLAVASTAGILPKPVAASRKPNVIVILADDLGYSDLSSYGNRVVSTPHIDALGKEGVRFTQAYVTAPICSPSRAGLFTGRYQQRFGYEFMPHNIPDLEALPESVRQQQQAFQKSVGSFREPVENVAVYNAIPKGIPASETTLAEFLKNQGYRTGLVGKWHLGETEGFYPDQHGFDYSYYFQGGGTIYYTDTTDKAYVNKRLPWCMTDWSMWQARKTGANAIREGRTVVDDKQYLTFSLAQKATSFLEQNKDNPFFLYLTFNAPHDPFQAPKGYFEKFAEEKDTTKRIYYAMISALDDAVGQVTQKVRDLGLEKNTLIVFISDNGGATYTRATDNYPLRGGKMSHFEGGFSVPFFLKYPGIVPAGKVYNQPVLSLDIYGTVAGILGTSPKLDGVNLIPYLTRQQKSRPHESIFWRSGYSKAFRKGDWKLYVNERNQKVMLFDLSKDRSETTDLSGTHPQKLAELLRDLQCWEKDEIQPPRWKNGSNATIQVNGENYFFPI